MSTYYELFTWKSPDSKPYILYFETRPQLSRVAISKYQLFEIHRNENHELVSARIIDEWNNQS